jgi:hypothetical protein
METVVEEIGEDESAREPHRRRQRQRGQQSLALGEPLRHSQQPSHHEPVGQQDHDGKKRQIAKDGPETPSRGRRFPISPSQVTRNSNAPRVAA